MRMRKKKNGAKRIEACSDIFIKEPEKNKGKWKEFSDFKEISIEIGCGKGRFILENAKRNPDKLYIGFEKVPDVIVLAMEKIKNEEIKNVFFICDDASRLCEIFDENEIDEIYLNFSDPWPKKRHAKRRLTFISFLEIYKKIIKDGGKIFFKTDNRDLFDFSLEQFEKAEIEVSDVCFDLHNSEYEKDNIHTEYEDNFSAKGFSINRLVGTVKKNVSDKEV